MKTIKKFLKKSWNAYKEGVMLQYKPLIDAGINPFI